MNRFDEMRQENEDMRVLMQQVIDMLNDMANKIEDGLDQI